MSRKKMDQIKILEKAVETTRDAYVASDYDPEKLAPYQAAVDALEAARAKIPAEPPLKNLTAAVQHLQDQGWKIKKSKVYADAKGGLLRVQPDRTVARADLDSYILRAGLEKTAAADTGGQIERGQAERLELENEKLRRQVEKLTWELDRDRGKYLLKEDVRTELALKIAALEAGIKHWMRTGAADLVYAVGGEAAKARVLINLFEARLDELLDEMGRCEELGIEVKKARDEGGNLKPEGGA